eukprot:397932_1
MGSLCSNCCSRKHKQKTVNTVYIAKDSLFSHEEAEVPLVVTQTYNMNVLKQDDRLCRLKNVMQAYNKNSTFDGFLENNYDISTILDDFLYLSTTYNKDEEFETIANELGHCNIRNCQIIRRHFRDRNQDILSNDYTDHLCDSLVDKIHCYYQHCFDIGYKLSTADKFQVYQLCQQS